MNEKPFSIDAELWSLLKTFAEPQALAGSRFPDVDGVAHAIRKLDTFGTLDARDPAPPYGRAPVAFSYRHFWWTFWEKAPPPPPNPDRGGSFNGTEPFDRLIVFPEFQGRMD